MIRKKRLKLLRMDDRLAKTIYLMSSEKNRVHLQKSIEQCRKGRTKECALIDLKLYMEHREILKEKTLHQKEKIQKGSVPENFTMGLAIFDSVPVIFFGAATILLGSLLNSVLFTIGAVLCFAAGFLKVVWKIIVVKKQKNIWWLFVQMRIVMPLGFLMMLIGLVIHWQDSAVAELKLMAFEMPVLAFLLVTLLCYVLMGIFAFVLDNGKARSNWIEQIINAIGQFAFLLAVILLTYASGTYKADAAADQALISTDTVQVTANENLVEFEPVTETQTGIVFYPGGNVQFTAYAPLLRQLSEQGIFCAVVRMPLNLGFLNTKAVETVMARHPEIEHWFLAGHSLGGVSASFYAAENPDQLDGLILLAAYSTKPLNDLSVLSIYGSEDGILNREAYNEAKINLPTTSREENLQGGNHCQFGSYGFQDGDGQAKITPVEQWNQTCRMITDFVLEILN